MAGRIWSSGENEGSGRVPPARLSALRDSLSAGAADVFRQRRQFDRSAFARRLPGRIQYLHHDHVGLKRSQVAVWLQASVKHRREVVERSVVGRRQRRSGALTFLGLPFGPHAHLVRPHGDQVPGRPVHFHILTAKRPVPRTHQHCLGFGITQDDGGFIRHPGIDLGLIRLGHGGHAQRRLAVHQPGNQVRAVTAKIV